MKNELANYRDQIDKIDKQLISLLDSRIEISKKVGNYKKENNIDILNSARETEILDSIKSYSKNYDIIYKIYLKILEESKKVQK